MTRPFRFAVQASSAASPTEWRSLARRAEDLGYAVLTVADHLDDQYATTPALMAAADATTTLRVGALVWCIDYHHPAVLAKEAATIDLLSDGRLEVGLGAGWMTADYEAAGIPMDRAGVRVDRLTETVTACKALWAGGPVTFRGEHVHLDGLVGAPLPRQRPHPPLCIGGGGRRVLSLAGREADIVAFNIDLRAGRIDERAGPTATAAAMDQKLAWVRDAAGGRFDALELQTRIHLAAVTDDRDTLAHQVGPAFGLTPDEALHSPHALAGSVEQIVETLLERRERWGLSMVGLSVDALETMAPVVAELAGR